MEEKVTVSCKVDEDVDKTAFMRCDVLENNKKTFLYTVYSSHHMMNFNFMESEIRKP